MKYVHATLLVAFSIACAAGCAKKELVVPEPAVVSAPAQLPATETVAPPATTIDAHESIAATDIAEDRITPAGNATQASPLKIVYFDFDAWVLNGAAREILAGNAEWLRKNPGVAVILEGHTDERGSDAYNLALGEQRAKSAMKYLQTLGIDAGRMTVVSYGEEKPAVEGHDESAWAGNRRVEFIPKR
ncbi:peptidoglycan-associated lipoprotein Pal [Geobacter sulfurreducens]|uniref:peptidoglycan-associated lipoprotein Pal n=1 Tax=Geobacter sulfurreducens TaxID=35554 RepID=UPI0005D7A799|nr:peptidoglycan-associated lipoprotein Pal [Geobacter sulfurreducens]AJY68532.1 peptidoglycan-binding protein [Geobacter sulfurreducens]BBA70747.1 Peptidoglycan-associated lipoprotein [Geobacter sulfurreducens]